MKIMLLVIATLALGGCEAAFCPPTSQASIAAVPYDYGAGKTPPR